MDSDLDTLLATWLRYQQQPADTDFWAIARMSELTGPDANSATAWNLVSQLVDRADDACLEAVAVGPLEDVVTAFGPRLIAQIEQRARQDPRFRSALARIWITAGELPPEIEARLIAASNGAIRPLSGRTARGGRARDA